MFKRASAPTLNPFFNLYSRKPVDTSIQKPGIIVMDVSWLDDDYQESRMRVLDKFGPKEILETVVMPTIGDPGLHFPWNELEKRFSPEELTEDMIMSFEIFLEAFVEDFYNRLCLLVPASAYHEYCFLTWLNNNTVALVREDIEHTCRGKIKVLSKL